MVRVSPYGINLGFASSILVLAAILLAVSSFYNAGSKLRQTQESVVRKRPNIVLIVADDYGWNDVGYHGSEIKTPVLDKLAAEGIKLENYYVQPICTPTRAQLLSGRYQIHTGMQHGVLRPCEPAGLPLQVKTLANHLQDEGYRTHLIGKWHIGMFKKEYLPTYRGFDSSFGYLFGTEDYYTHYRTFKEFSALDFYNNLAPHNGSYGKFSTHVFVKRTQDIIRQHDGSRPLFLYNAFQSVHAPLQVPDKYRQQYNYIRNEDRKTYAGMVSAMDEAVGAIVEELKSSDLWKDTLLLFTTDNGGQVSKGANNAPLRGCKDSYFEGGIRAVGFLSGPYVENFRGKISNQLVHVSDWLPTLVELAGGSVDYKELDGYNQWDSITRDRKNPREEILFNIDPLERKGKSVSTIFDTAVQAAIRYKDWKLLTGDPRYDGWVPKPTNKNYHPQSLNRHEADNKNVYLFNIRNDPEERNELSKEYPHIVRKLLTRLARWNATAVPVNKPHLDLRCDPGKRGGVWGPWL